MTTGGSIAGYSRTREPVIGDEADEHQHEAQHRGENRPLDGKLWKRHGLRPDAVDDGDRAAVADLELARGHHLVAGGEPLDDLDAALAARAGHHLGQLRPCRRRS